MMQKIRTIVSSDLPDRPGCAALRYREVYPVPSTAEAAGIAGNGIVIVNRGTICDGDSGEAPITSCLSTS